MTFRELIEFDDLHERYQRGDALTALEAERLARLAARARAELPTGETEIVRAMRIRGEALACAEELLKRTAEAALTLAGTAIVSAVKGTGK